jgi:hypothetical protein
MAQPITWTPFADSILLHMRSDGAPWPEIARHLHVGRSAVIERARSLGIPSKTRLPQPMPTPPVPRIDRAPLPAGHPLTWGAITESTQARGTPYPHPVFL